MNSSQRPTKNPGTLKRVAVVIGMVCSIALSTLRTIAALLNRKDRKPSAPSMSDASRKELAAPRPGWNTAQPTTLLKPTYWPIVLALGIACIFWGLTSTLVVSYIGVVLFILALANWIGLLRHEG